MGLCKNGSCTQLNIVIPDINLAFYAKFLCLTTIVNWAIPGELVTVSAAIARKVPEWFVHIQGNHWLAFYS